LTALGPGKKKNRKEEGKKENFLSLLSLKKKKAPQRARSRLAEGHP